jgi:hypothetical protein
MTSLRDAVNFADSFPGPPHTITIDPSLANQTIALNSAIPLTGN